MVFPFLTPIDIRSVWTMFLWFLYPIAWGLSEGGNVISSDSEAVFYGILDFLAKPCFGALLLWGHRNLEPSRLGINIRTPLDHPEHYRETKTNPSNGVVASNGTSTAIDA